MNTSENEGTRAGPSLSAEERKGLRDFLEVYQSVQEEIRAALLERARTIPGFEAVLRSTPAEELAEQSRLSQDLLRRAIEQGEWGQYIDNLRHSGRTYARLNVPFPAWFDLTGAYEAVLTPRLVQAYGDDPPRLTRTLLAAHRYLELALAEIGDAYLGAKEVLIAQQQRALLELSTPVLQVRERMLILPIVGVLDTRRARQLTQQLLGSIRSTRARVVVMDITGVPAVDSKVANHLLQTVSAAGLMGALVVVSGLSPEVAQALVLLGVDLERLQTVGDLQSGMELADRLMGYRVVQVGEAMAAPARPER